MCRDFPTEENKRALAEAQHRHDDYHNACLNADKMVIPLPDMRRSATKTAPIFVPPHWRASHD
jgi:hypothetical protein